AAIPSSLLYRVSGGSGTGLAATYYDTPGFAGRSVQRVDPTVDLGTGPSAGATPPGGVSPPSVSGVWRGGGGPANPGGFHLGRHTRRHGVAVSGRAGSVAARGAGAARGPRMPPRHLRARRQAHRQHDVSSRVPPVRRSDLRAGSLLLQRWVPVLLLERASLGC